MSRKHKLMLASWVVGMIGLGLIFAGFDVLGRLIIVPALAVFGYAVLSGIYQSFKVKN